MSKGEVVNVRLYGGSTAPRRVVADKGSVIVICAEEEFQRATIQNREPEGVGFPRVDVIIPTAGEVADL